jgi:hypothetical protein
MLDSILKAAIQDTSRDAPDSLQALFASRLPFELGQNSDGRCSLLGHAALAGRSCAAKVRLLHQAGIQVTIADVLYVSGRLAPPGLAALLSVGRPAVDTRQASQTAGGCIGYSCPIHRVLRLVVHSHRWTACHTCRHVAGAHAAG